jgi:hypothetical protein
MRFSDLKKIYHYIFYAELSDFVQKMRDDSRPLTLKMLARVQSRLPALTDDIFTENPNPDVVYRFSPIFRCTNPVVLSILLLDRRYREKRVNAIWKTISREKEQTVVTQHTPIYSVLLSGNIINLIMLMLAGASIEDKFIENINVSAKKKKKVLRQQTVRDDIKEKQKEDKFTEYTCDSTGQPKKILQQNTVKGYIQEKQKKSRYFSFSSKASLALYLSDQQEKQANLQTQAAKTTLPLNVRMTAYKNLARFYNELLILLTSKQSSENENENNSRLDQDVLSDIQKQKKNGVILKIHFLVLIIQVYKNALQALNEYKSHGLDTKVERADVVFQMQKLYSRFPGNENKYKIPDYWNLFVPQKKVELTTVSKASCNGSSSRQQLEYLEIDEPPCNQI